MAVGRVERLANGTRHREARDRRHLASPGISPVLDVEESSAHGGPTIASEVRGLIQTMSRENPLWGVPRIHGELLKLGVQVSQATVAKYMARPGTRSVAAVAHLPRQSHDRRRWSRQCGSGV